LQLSTQEKGKDATMARTTTLDHLPEFTTYKDTGCDVHSSCLTCPLPRCRYDEPGWLLREERTSRNAEIMKFRMSGQASIDDLASRFGVSVRTVHRILQQYAPSRQRIAS
jgi:AraC-like DNA-binding protein